MKNNASKFIAVSVTLLVVLTFFFIGGFGELNSFPTFQKDVQTMAGNSRTLEEESVGLSNDSLPAVSQATALLSAGLGISSEYISPIFTRAEMWPDSCLGLPEEGKMCAQVITPGYVVVLQVDGKEYAYRSNSDGSILRFDVENYADFAL